jgi:hypothetical protein
VNNRSLVLFLSGLSACAAAAFIAVSCSDQPRPKCTTGRGQFSAVYKAISVADAGCALTGEAIGVEAYNPPLPDMSNADLNKGSIAIKGGEMAAAIAAHKAGVPDTTHDPNSIGNFSTSEPGGDDFCNVPSLTAGEQQLLSIPAVPPPADAGPDAEGTPEVPATNIKYEWSNVRVIVQPTALGTQMVGDLTYTKDGCQATYRVHALFPSIACEKTVDDAGTTGPNFCACLPYGDPANNRPAGSGLGENLFGPQPPPERACELSPDNEKALLDQAKVTCDPDLHLCVLKGEPPSYAP